MPNITTKSNDPRELAIVEIVKGIYKKYPIPAFTNEILIERGTNPHSHPILTLNTRVNDERLILKTLLHELFHWYVTDRPQHDQAISFLKTKYEDNGECNISGQYPNSFWSHIIVCFNTHNYLKKLLPTEDVIWVYQQWQSYPNLEKLIQEKNLEIKADLEKFGLIYNE